jgi:hypothetical protein
VLVGQAALEVAADPAAVPAVGDRERRAGRDQIEQGGEVIAGAGERQRAVGGDRAGRRRDRLQRERRQRRDRGRGRRVG